MLVILISVLAFYNRFQVFPQEYQFYVRTLLDILIFYLNYSILVPRLLLNKKILLYVVVTISFIFLLSYLKDVLLPPRDLNPEMLANQIDFRPPGKGLKRPNKNIFMGVQILFGVLLFAVGASIKLVSEWYKNEKQKELLCLPSMCNAALK